MGNFEEGMADRDVPEKIVFSFISWAKTEIDLCLWDSLDFQVFLVSWFSEYGWSEKNICFPVLEVQLFFPSKVMNIYNLQQCQQWPFPFIFRQHWHLPICK